MLLDEREPSSVVLSKTSKKSRIAGDYHDFVQKSSGIINRVFQDDIAARPQYRLTLSDEIDLGESWHLAIFIAHLLFSNSRLATGDVSQGDEIILATGEIDVSTNKVRHIHHLAQKCFRARHQITQLYSASHLASFFVPASNYRQPLPDVDMVLTPINDISELFSFFSRLGIGSENLVSTNQTLTSTPRNEGGIEIIGVKKSWVSKKVLVIAVCLLALISVYLLVPNQTAMIEKRVGLNACIETDETIHEFALHQIIELPDIYMHGLCSLEFTLPHEYKSAFIMAENSQFLALEQTRKNHWFLPAPQDKRQPRAYIIAFTTSTLDEADLHTLRAIASDPDNLAAKKSSVERWASTNNKKIHILRHRLR